MNDHVAAPPDRDTFAQRFAPAAARARPIRELHALLTTADPDAPFEMRRQWLEKLARWLTRGPLPALRNDVASDPDRGARLRLLVDVLEQIGGWRMLVADTCASVLRETNAFTLLSRLGLPGDRSFLAETTDRISRRFLPAPRDERDIAQLLERMLGKPRDVAYVAGLDAELVARLIAVLDDGTTFHPLAHSAADAALLLATRISALGLSDDIRVRSPRTPLRDSPLFRLPRAADALLALLERSPPPAPEELSAAWSAMQALMTECEGTVAAVTRNLEQFGVSVDVVYRLEVMTKSMARLRMLLDPMMPRSAAERAHGATRLLARLLEDRLRDRSTLDLARTSLHLLARKIIERAGHTGEHYITATRAEYGKMLASAGGGGVLTSGTACMKFLIMWGQFAPFVEGVFASTNYAASFLLMQALGLTLATKQPSMTAAALAATLREREGHTDMEELVTAIARITRSQLAAAIGNIGLVIPAAIVLDLVYQARVGHHFLDHDTAEHVVQSLHVTRSGSLFFAALTGVLLWLSSIAAGWIENWAVYRRLPEAIAQHRVGRVVGRRTTELAARAFTRNIAGVGGNVSIGFLLGMTPSIGKFFGIPLEVRHVTLSTGSLVFAFVALGAESSELGAIWAVIGIAAIGALNFGVSFVLALLVALRARDVTRLERMQLLRAIAARVRTHPREFLLPP